MVIDERDAITGRIYDAANYNDMVPGATVVATPQITDMPVIIDYTDEDGRYRLFVARGTYRVTAHVFAETIELGIIDVR